VLVDGKKVYIELGYGECEPATLQQALERIASEICYQVPSAISVAVWYTIK
jgi:hypothetical protein